NVIVGLEMHLCEQNEANEKQDYMSIEFCHAIRPPTFCLHLDSNRFPLTRSLSMLHFSTWLSEHQRMDVFEYRAKVRLVALIHRKVIVKLLAALRKVVSEGKQLNLT